MSVRILRYSVWNNYSQRERPRLLDLLFLGWGMASAMAKRAKRVTETTKIPLISLFLSLSVSPFFKDGNENLESHASFPEPRPEPRVKPSTATERPYIHLFSLLFPHWKRFWKEKYSRRGMIVVGFIVAF